MKSGNLNFLEPSGPLQACNGTALPFTFSCLYICNYESLLDKWSTVCVDTYYVGLSGGTSWQLAVLICSVYYMTSCHVINWCFDESYHDPVQNNQNNIPAGTANTSQNNCLFTNTDVLPFRNALKRFLLANYFYNSKEYFNYRRHSIEM